MTERHRYRIEYRDQTFPWETVSKYTRAEILRFVRGHGWDMLADGRLISLEAIPNEPRRATEPLAV